MQLVTPKMHVIGHTHGVLQKKKTGVADMSTHNTSRMAVDIQQFVAMTNCGQNLPNESLYVNIPQVTNWSILQVYYHIWTKKNITGHVRQVAIEYRCLQVIGAKKSSQKGQVVSKGLQNAVSTV